MWTPQRYIPMVLTGSIVVIAFVLTSCSGTTEQGAEEQESAERGSAGQSVARAAEPGTASPDAAEQESMESQKGDSVNHAVFDGMLKKYVDDKGMIDYRTWKARDLATLDGYLEMLEGVDPEGLEDRNEVFAFWINTYNALTIRAMLHFYPTSSIRNHVSVLGYSIWKDYKITIRGQEYSLDDIEHKILRKMDEPLIHFALVCASIGCPPLMTEAFTAEDLDRQLRENTLVFFADPGKFRADPENRTVWLSPIMDWYKDDFGKNWPERLRFIAPYVPDDAARALLKREDVEVDYLDYDWGINEQINEQTNEQQNN